MSAIYCTEAHTLFRKTVRTFAEAELRPHATEWEAAGAVPRSVYRRAGALGYLGLRHAPEHGGSGLDYTYTVILCEELMRTTCVGIAVGFMVQSEMATSVIADVGTATQQQAYLQPALRGEKIAAIGVTEPGYGSDVAGLRTRAVVDGDDYVINGNKIFISNGTQADFITLAVRTGGDGHGGISLVLFPTTTPGFAVGRKLDKMGARSNDTAELFFDNCRIPRANLLGEAGRGFAYIMKHFQGERLILAAFANGMMQVMWEEGLRYGHERRVFGRPILAHQVWRHRLADLLTELEASKQLTYLAAYRLSQGERAEQEVSMAKLYASELLKRAANEILQLHGGIGYMEETPICRLYRDAAGFTIGGGTSEIMREIIAKEAGM